LDLSLTAENISAQFLTTLARHMKKNLPEDISTTGAMSASLAVRATADGIRVWTGDAKISALQVRSSVLEKPLLIEPTTWRLIGPGTSQFVPPSTKAKRILAQQRMPQPDSPAFSFDPIAIPAGGSSPATLRGWFSRRNFDAEFKGSADVDRLFQLARLAGLPTSASDLSGSATGSVTLTGGWNNFKPADYLADAQLQNVTARISGVATPVSIRSAHFVADPSSATLAKATASIPGLHSEITFSSTWPKNCDPKASDGNCFMHFDVAADQLSSDELNSLLNPKAQKQPWYAAIANSVIGSDRKSFPELHATGKIFVGKLLVKDVPAQHVTASLEVSPQGFTLTDINAEVFGGRYTGELSSDFRGGTPVYESKGKLQSAAFNNIAAVMKDDWASGKVDISYSGKAAGWKSDELLSSAAGTANFQWRDGTFRHIELDSPGKPLQFRSFAGAIALKDATLTLAESKLQAQKGIYQVSGTASLERELKFTLARDGAPSFSISGSLEKPRVAPAKQSPTEANLK
ncbi:MAG TPA: AsmA-like C-terminal region-containing protein, partial [Terriglobales bacterium]|nr:AsmA-like C-terminal region-containing protein [Terriglobales bacterium]